MDTNKMRDISREQFEAWFRKEYQLGADDEINFANGEVRMMLKGWIASRATLTVELPSESCVRLNDYTPYEAVQACKRAVEAQGLEVEL